MPFAKWERVIQDPDGNLVENCQVTVRRLPGLVLQPLKADYDGASSKSNPFTVTDGRAKFYAAAGRYQISVVAPGGFTATYTDELVGTLQGQDANAYVGPGFTFAPEEETAAPPSEGCIRSNQADWSDTTHLYVSDTTLSAADATSYLLGLDPGSKSIKNRVLLSLPDGSELSWEVDDVSDAGDYLDITVSGYVGPAGPVSVAPSGYVVLAREISGVDGDAATIAVGTVDSVPAGDPATVTNSGTSAAAVFDFDIPQGDPGNAGWSPQLVIESDGARRVFKLDGYVGGAGSPPTANVGEYLKADGTFTATIGDAVDVRGPAGANGSGTVADVVSGTGITVDDTDPANPIVGLSTTTQNTINSKITMGKAVAAAIVFG